MTDVPIARPRLKLVKLIALQLAHVDTCLPILKLSSRENVSLNLPVHADEWVMEEAWLADSLTGDPLTDALLLHLFL